MVPTTFLLWHLDYCSALKRPSHTLLPALKADVCTEKSCSLPLLHCRQILLLLSHQRSPVPPTLTCSVSEAWVDLLGMGLHTVQPNLSLENHSKY